MSSHRHVVIIGGQRCGSTLLARTLGRHPEIASAEPPIPEPRFFIESRDHDEYHRRHFPVDRPICLEKSTTYMERPECIDNMAHMAIDLVTIVILRDPVDRAISNWRFSTANGLEFLAAEKAITEMAETRNFPRHMSTSPYHYIKRSRYGQLLGPWLNDQRLPAPVILLFEQLIEDPNRVMHDLEDRIGLESDLRFDSSVVNASEFEGNVSARLRGRLGEMLVSDAEFVQSLVPQVAEYWPTLGGVRH